MKIRVYAFYETDIEKFPGQNPTRANVLELLIKPEATFGFEDLTHREDFSR